MNYLAKQTKHFAADLQLSNIMIVLVLMCFLFGP